MSRRMGLFVGYLGFFVGALYGNWILLVVGLLVTLNELASQEEEMEE